MRIWHAYVAILGAVAFIALLNSGVLPLHGEAAKVMVAVMTAAFATTAITTVALLIWSGSPRNRHAVEATDAQAKAGEDL